jgi:hypothetical protein
MEKRSAAPIVAKDGHDYSAIRSHLDVVAFNTNGKPGHVHDGRHRQHFAISDVEARAVSRAFDLKSVQLTFGDRAAIVGADIFDGVVRSTHIKHADIVTLHIKYCSLAGGNLGGLGNCYKAGQNTPPLDIEKHFTAEDAEATGFLRIKREKPCQDYGSRQNIKFQ